MKTTRLLSLLALAAMFGFSSCQKEEADVTANEISPLAMAKISEMGFNTDNVQRTEGGYIVEGDIFFSEGDLQSSPETTALRVGEEEQYRTNNLVSVGTSRTINVAITTSLPSSYVTALDEAIRRFNAESLRLKFRRVSSGYNILISKAPSGSSYLASAGFPSGGNPYNSVKVNSDYLGTNPGTNYLATILAHEIGHTIGFRHTDYMNRAYSCGGSYYNEGASTVGAVHIPGTPTGADPNSWMLACIGSGVNRYFNSNDRTALRYLYQ
ncbi:M57 family metalloprotease [Pontibacter sp. BT731]|uniref:M57 family metalloprotease n=1 Tax=Pontibacter coccineus TaxID=3063328 RepID=UPI0026E2BA09|nr:M57 family metalloprotease [Pontibacter sp. BT731]MDO6392484.1 M57 family metalloprotease [Pontibacter sp. BT731]